ncbi:MAG: DUF2019 domain-containing protein [Methyloceanibacter sp.]|uniref:DUF2019 domain-containing protein n=1 Tax=Methyloceanibacter sp. TaxID=1965321 RepID=UPI003D6D49D1
MKRVDLGKLSIEELFERYVAIGFAEEDAVLYDDTPGYNRLFRKEQAVVDELRSRPGDQRRLLLALYDHENLWVRLSAVRNSLVFAPEEGRRVLQEIVDSKRQPYAGDAGMTMRALDRGIFKPT